MMVVMNRLKCPSGYAEHLERAFKHAGNLEGVPGFRNFSFLRNVRDGNEAEYVAITTWDSSDAYQAWRKSESFARAHSEASSNSPITSTLELYDVLE